MSWKEALISPKDTIKRALEAIDVSTIQLALIVDSKQRLLGVVTDGDIRRAFLNGKHLDDTIAEIMTTTPKTAVEGTTRSEVIRMMRKYALLQIPILDDERKVVDVIKLEEVVTPGTKPNPVVLMAGGLGSRLRPLTKDCPKPLLEVGGKPILETIIEQFKRSGFYRFYISVNYLGHKIEDYFGDGSDLDCEIKYIHEEDQMGTAGALGLIEEKFEHPFFVMNGDLLTTLNFEQFLEFHLEHGFMATMGVRDYDFQVPYGVVNVKGHLFEGVDEKPIQRYFVNAGIYLLEPHALKLLQPDVAMNMTELFKMIRQKGERSAVFPIREYWMDIGRMDDYEKANGEFDRFFG